MTLPEDFISYTRQLMGEERFNQFLKGMSEEPPTSIRLNPFKFFSDSEVGKNKEEAFSLSVETNPVPWCPTTGRYLSTRHNFTFDPLFHAGKYYVQEASSMFVNLAIEQLVKEPVVMLDLCAAPGGKSTAVRAALPKGSLLFSNEPMRPRCQILAENVQKFGHPEMIVTNNYPKDYKKSKLQFDVILTDVPCSGEGMFRKDEGAITEWNVKNVENCWQLQRDIVSDIWNCLKPGGILIYSTCTFNAKEDEQNVEWIAQELGADFIPLNISDDWHITGNLLHGSSTAHGDNTENMPPVYRFIPGITQGEGLFMAVLRKHGDWEPVLQNFQKKEKNSKKDFKKKDKKAVKGKGMDIPAGWLNDDQEYTACQTTDSLYAIPTQWKELYDKASQTLKIVHAGIKLGTFKGKDLIPSQGLALSTALHHSQFPQVEVSYEDAIRYLRKEAITLPADTPKGYVLISFHDTPIGWMKNIGNRANNLYPQEWKIKSTHIPEGNNLLLK